IKWTAWTLQHPDQRAETALVFRGGQGTGKGVLGRVLCELFRQHGVHISFPRQLTGNFNKHLLDCAVLFPDETFLPGGQSSEGTLKRIVTENTIGHLEKFFSPSRYESDSLTAMGHGRMERASHGADGLFRR